MPEKVMLPLTGEEEVLSNLRSGDSVLLCGVMYSARDTACKRIFAALERGQPPPFDVRGQTIYFTGPSPAKPGQVIGAAGPTTSGRMNSYLPRLIAEGLKGVIGKGSLSPEVRKAMKSYKAVYFAAIGGTGALISQSVKKAEVIAYEELGAEAILKLEVENFPVIVINDIYGGDLYQEGRAKYQIEA